MKKYHYFVSYSIGSPTPTSCVIYNKEITLGYPITSMEHIYKIETAIKLECNAFVHIVFYNLLRTEDDSTNE